MPADSSFIHPSLFFIVLALALPFLPRRSMGLWRWALLLPGALALWSIYATPQGVHGVGQWLGLTVVTGRVDALSTIFAHVFAIQAFLGMLYGLHEEKKSRHVAALFYMAGAFGCLYAGDYLTLFVFWEMMSVASTFLVWLNRSERSLKAGFRYFLFHTLGGLLLLGGALLRWQALGTFAFDPVAPAAVQYYDWLILAGVCVNAAVVPLHAWLPDAYPEATVAGAVFMSAFTTKTAVYVLARGFSGFEVLAVMGVVMTLYGVAYASIENNARRILSYHIVSQVGYMVAGIGIGTAMTIDGACAHAYAHILYKGLLFMSAGAILFATGTAKLDELGGLVGRLPGVMLLYMVAAVSISGVPLFSGFVSKTMTITGAAEAHRTWLAVGMELAAVGTFLSVGLKLPYFAFWAKPDDTTRPLRPIPWNMYAAMTGGAILCFLIGVYPNMLYALLPLPVEYHPYEPAHVLQACLLIGFTGLGFYLMRRVITPHAWRNLDFEYLYRFVGRGFVAVVSWPAARFDDLWSDVYRTVGLRGLLKGAEDSSIFDRKVIDGVVDGTAETVRGVGGSAARAQTGQLQDYLAGAVIVGLGLFMAIWYFG